MKANNTDLGAVFGGGKSAAPAGPSLRASADEAYSDAPPAPEDEDEEAGEAVPAEFATHALEAFPSLDDSQLRALYRAIESCK